MRLGKRFGPSAIEKSDIWSPWKAGQSLLEIGRRTFAQEEPQTDPKADNSPATALDVIASKETQGIVQSLVELAKAFRK